MQLTTIEVDQLAEHHGLDTLLVTRPMGRVFLAALREQLASIANQAIVLDFTGISLMDASFADEVFGNLGSERARRVASFHQCIFLKAMDEASIENLDMALSSRTRREKNLRNCVVPYVDSVGKVRLVGKWEAHVEETFHLFRQYPELTARQVMELLNLDIGAASTRLKALFDLGLICRSETRDGDSKQYDYSLPSLR